MNHYVGFYVLMHGYLLHPSPTYIAWSFGTGMFRQVAERALRRSPWTWRDDAPGDDIRANAETVGTL